MVGETAALGSALLWAVSSILMGSLTGRMPAVVISALRALFGAAFLLAVAALLLVSGAARAPGPAAAASLAGSGVLGLGLGDTAYIRSLRHIGVSRAFPVSMAAYPLLTFVLAVALIGEEVTLPVAMGAALVIAGVILVVLGGRLPGSEGRSARSRREVWLGTALVLTAAVLWAFASVWLRAAADGVQPAVAQAIRLPVAAVVTAGLARGAGHALWSPRYGWRGLMALLLTGVVGTGAGSMLFVLAVQRAGAAKTAVLSSTAPLFALPLAALLLGERLTGRVVLGTVLSIAGVWLVVAPG
jgi:drug/metabolite transporter (DMT)-like permease